jgi:hypothetical protein
MRQHLFNDGYTVPTAFVTKGRQRVKQYNNTTVYLNNGDEFEIELFNPTINKVLAKIELNGKSIGAGIVLRPGERVFLERYLDEAKRFLFETYAVDGNNPNVQRAIAENGNVDIKFYCENTYYGCDNWSGGNPSWTYTTWPLYNPTFTNSSGRGFASGRTTIKSAGLSYGEPVVDSCFYMSNTVNNSLAGGNNPVVNSNSLGFADMAPSNPIETGRVEKGSNSNQSFMCDNSSFNTWWSWRTEWKILPFSQKPLVREDLKVFCTSCGSRRKKQSHKFCPNCGAKY